jgi:hypothetical protein
MVLFSHTDRLKQPSIFCPILRPEDLLFLANSGRKKHSLSEIVQGKISTDIIFVDPCLQKRFVIELNEAIRAVCDL